MKKFQPTARIACEPSTSSSRRQVRAATNSLSIAQCQDPVEEVLDCTVEQQSVEVLSEIIELTPDAAPELEAQAFVEQAKDSFRPPTPPPTARNRYRGSRRVSEDLTDGQSAVVNEVLRLLLRLLTSLDLN